MLIRPKYLMARSQHPWSAFTRFDFLLVIAILAVIGALFYVFVINTDAKQHLQVCLENQQKIGSAFTQFMEDNGDNLPHAAISTNQFPRSSWDFSLRYYLSDGAISTNTPFSLDARAKGQEVARYFRCPADEFRRVQAARPRSYAMPLHRPNRRDWPPTSESLSGVGLVMRINFDDEGNMKLPKWRLKTDTNQLTYINKSIITNPTDTLMVTERASEKNALYSLNSTIKTTAEHVDDSIPLHQYHGGVINYLMVDGHAESLRPEQTVGWDGAAGTNVTSHRGIWTIKAGD